MFFVTKIKINIEVSIGDGLKEHNDNPIYSFHHIKLYRIFVNNYVEKFGILVRFTLK